MPFIKIRNGKENKFYKVNKVGAKIASYTTIGLIMHTDTFKVLDYGELSDMKKVIDEKYYNHPQAQYRNYKCILYYSSNWIPEALTRIIDDGDTEFARQMEESRTDRLFVEELSIGMSYHPYAVSGAPSAKEIKEREDLLLSRSKTENTNAPANDSERLEKAKEESRKRREALFGGSST